jgi:glutaredoxin 3
MSQNNESIQYIYNIISLTNEKVTLFSKDYCPYCIAAKNLLSKLYVKYHELNIDETGFPYSSSEVRRHLIEGFEVRTFPQIFIGTIHVGGYDELKLIFKDQTLYTVLGANEVIFVRPGT